jgi:hypothetical protein
VPTAVLVITGPVGVGKTAVAFELIELLEERDVRHAFFDLDGLTYFFPKPPDDAFGERFALETLGLLFPRLRDYGIDRLILARVLWERESVDFYRAALPSAEITVVRLTAPLTTIEERIRRREVGSAVDWYLARARELDARWAENPVEDVLVETGERDVRSIAEEILGAVGWSEADEAKEHTCP